MDPVTPKFEIVIAHPAARPLVRDPALLPSSFLAMAKSPRALSHPPPRARCVPPRLGPVSDMHVNAGRHRISSLSPSAITASQAQRLTNKDLSPSEVVLQANNETLAKVSLPTSLARRSPLTHCRERA